MNSGKKRNDEVLFLVLITLLIRIHCRKKTSQHLDALGVIFCITIDDFSIVAADRAYGAVLALDCAAALPCATA